MDWNESKLGRLDPRHIYKSIMNGGETISSTNSANQNHKNQFTKLPNRIQVISSSSPSNVNPHQLFTKNLLQLTRFDLLGTQIGIQEVEATETLKCLWPFFRLSRCIGMVPITKRDNQLVVAKYWHPSWIITYLAIGIQTIMIGNAVKKIETSGNPADMIKGLNVIIYYGHTLANCLYMSSKIRQLPHLLAVCRRIETVCRKYQEQLKPDNLIRHCFLLFLFFTGTQALGNLLFFASVAHKNNVRTIPQFFRSFNSEFIGNWGNFYSGVFFCFGELYSDMGWGFADILLALISVVLGRFFSRLNQILERAGSRLSLSKIEELRGDHREICYLVQVCNNIFSPLFLLTYVANIAYLFTRLYTGLSDDLNDPVITVRVESLYAFCYQIFIKIMAPSYLASRLHEQAHDGLKLIHNWPSGITAHDSKHRLLVMGRFVSQLVTNPIGISGCGYFIISKSFMVTLISALVTYEVIILQFQGASLKSE